jgi:hypothetical protein
LGFPAAAKSRKRTGDERPQSEIALLAGWLKAEWRCLVPATSFCEWTDSRPKVTHWFAIDETLRVLDDSIELLSACQSNAGPAYDAQRMGHVA